MPNPLETDPPYYPPQVVLQALVAQNLTSFTEYAFSVVRPGVEFKPNWLSFPKIPSAGIRA
jgi:hypothetical protein